MTAGNAKPRGVLHPQPTQSQFIHERYSPSAALTDLVEHYWCVRWDLRELPPQRQATLPHPNVHLVIERNESYVYGVHTDRFERLLEGRGFTFGIKFKPGGFHPFLQAPISTLANRSMPAQTVFGADCQSLATRIATCATTSAMTLVAEAFLLAQRPQPDPNVARANRLVAAIADNLGITSVNQLLGTAAIDKRALQRLFHKYVGVGPKWVIQRYRLHEAIAQLQAHAPRDWSRLALELGYFDQAHFARDFRALVGQSPSEYVRSLHAENNGIQAAFAKR